MDAPPPRDPPPNVELDASEPMKDKSPSWSELFGMAMQNLGDALVQRVDDALLATQPKLAPTAPAVDPELRRWAHESALEVLYGQEAVRSEDEPNLARAYDPEYSPCVDFGRVVERVPALAIGPRDREELADVLVTLADRTDMTLTVRGAGMSTGGQSLSRDGAVIRTWHLDRIDVSKLGESGLVTVEGGATWADLVDALEPHDRLPAGLPFRWDASVGGTIAAGAGVGPTSHRDGFAADHVVALTLMTLDGELHRTRPDEAMFDAAVGGRGAGYVIVDATLETTVRPHTLAESRAGWESLADFFDDVISITEDEAFDHVAVRRTFVDAWPVLGGIGLHVEDADAGLPLERIRDLNADLEPTATTNVRSDYEARWRYQPVEVSAPAVAFTLPFPSGIDAWKDIEDVIDDARLGHALAHSGWAQVIPTHHEPDGQDRPRRPPGIPVPHVDASYLLYGELQPMVRQHRARSALDAIAEIRGIVVQAGGRIVAGSARPSRTPAEWKDELSTDELAVRAAFREAHDPERRLNPHAP